jgi:hypothetical protein
MMSADLSVMSNAAVSPIDLLWMDHRLMWTPTSTTYENWVAAGKPCLRQNCGHHHGNHIPSEAMECNECDCLGFVGFAHSDQLRSSRRFGATPAIKSPRYPKRRPRESPDARQGLSSLTDPKPPG